MYLPNWPELSRKFIVILAWVEDMESKATIAIWLHAVCPFKDKMNTKTSDKIVEKKQV